MVGGKVGWQVGRYLEQSRVEEEVDEDGGSEADDGEAQHNVVEPES